MKGENPYKLPNYQPCRKLQKIENLKNYFLTLYSPLTRNNEKY